MRVEGLPWDSDEESGAAKPSRASTERSRAEGKTRRSASLARALRSPHLSSDPKASTSVDVLHRGYCAGVLYLIFFPRRGGRSGGCGCGRCHAGGRELLGSPRGSRRGRGRIGGALPRRARHAAGHPRRGRGRASVGPGYWRASGTGPGGGGERAS
ncbi:unnamed protein product [Urochloa humidicola]